jgi:hypothetical protein
MHVAAIVPRVAVALVSSEVAVAAGVLVSSGAAVAPQWVVAAECA